MSAAHDRGSTARDDPPHHAADDHIDDHTADGHDDHDDDHHAEPVLPEPESPAWLPVLGGALFLLALLAFLFVNSEEAEAQKDAPAAAEQQAAVAPAAPAGRDGAPSGTALAPRVRPLLPGMMAPRAGDSGGPAAAPNRANPPTFGGPARVAPGEPPRPSPQ